MEETQNTEEVVLENTQSSQEETNGRVYELAYIFVPTLDEAMIEESFNSLRDLLITHKVEVISHDAPRSIELAYEMSRTIQNKKTWFSEGYFGWIKFEAEASVVKEINDILMRDEKIIRFMIVKTVRENTIFSKKAYTRTRRESPNKEEDTHLEDEAPKVELTEGEVDKEIDAMLEN